MGWSEDTEKRLMLRDRRARVLTMMKQGRTVDSITRTIGNTSRRTIERDITYLRATRDDVPATVVEGRAVYRNILSRAEFQHPTRRA